mgnify:FL=1
MILIQQLPDHDDEIVADIYPVAIDEAVGGDVPDHLIGTWHTVLSSFFSSFSLGLGSCLKEESFPPFSMMLISSLTSLLSSCSLWL